MRWRGLTQKLHTPFILSNKASRLTLFFFSLSLDDSSSFSFGLLFLLRPLTYTYISLLPVRTPTRPPLYAFSCISAAAGYGSKRRCPLGNVSTSPTGIAYLETIFLTDRTFGRHDRFGTLTETTGNLTVSHAFLAFITTGRYVVHDITLILVFPDIPEQLQTLSIVKSLQIIAITASTAASNAVLGYGTILFVFFIVVLFIIIVRGTKIPTNVSLLFFIIDKQECRRR
mmetsp:Transcript_8897/g.20575  ORF Transcript_8897/g.20575 Transcript_8897/m.20575 type:complete len:228 (-) Transcript_8897:177-860(-)